MLLKDYYPKLNKKYSNLNFKGISFDSKLIKKDFIFFAIKGNNVDGNNYIKEAIARGSKIIISEKYKEGLNSSVLYLKNKNPRKLLAEFAVKLNYKKPNNLTEQQIFKIVWKYINKHPEKRHMGLSKLTHMALQESF